ncbi:hypothetical protein [Oceanotoga phage vB_OteS-UFV02]
MKLTPNIDLSPVFVAIKTGVSSAQTYADLDMKNYEYGFVSVPYTKSSGTTLKVEVLVSGVSLFSGEADPTSTQGVLMVDAMKYYDDPKFTIKVTPSASADYSVVLNKYNKMEV